jgi:hypothetical protein
MTANEPTDPRAIERELRFAWPETHEAAAEALASGELRAEASGRRFVGREVELRVPLLWPRAAEGEDLRSWLARLPVGPGLHAIVLVQAGATALGIWEDDEMLAHKAEKFYVVRGNGRAQPTHLKTRGKSRYGSRLRLQNFQRQLAELNARLITWWEEFGPPETLFLACPKRIVPELWRREPRPPFERGDARPQVRKIPLDVRVPTYAELLRVRRFLTRGRVRWFSPREEELE